MEQGRVGGEPTAEAWVEERVRAGAEWAVDSLAGRGATAYARYAVRKCPTFLENRVVERLVPGVGRE